MSIFGKSHFVSNGIYASNVISVQTDQRNLKDVIITCNNCIRVYEPNERTVLESWMFKSWMAPVSGCVSSSKGEFYCPVAANSVLKWTAEDNQLENLPQVKFRTNVSSLESVSGAVYAVFEGGSIEEISQAMFQRKVKKPQILPALFVVQQLQIGEGFITVVAASKGEGGSTKIFQYPLGCTSSAEVLEFQLARPLLSLTGVCLLSYCRAVTLWSNGDLCVSAVCPQDGRSEPALTVRLLGNLGTSVDCARPAALLPMCDWVLAVLGLDVSKDGGRIVLWDIENHIEVAKRNYKLYQPSLRCWVGGLGENGGAILLHEKQELTVVPINKLPPRGIAPYILNQPPLSAAHTGDLVVKDWRTGKTKDSTSASVSHTSFTPLIDTLMSQLRLHTLDQSLCISRLVNEATERRSLDLACEVMVSFKGALPERCIVDLMTLLFAADCSDLAKAAVKYVNLASHGPTTTPPSLCSFFERLYRTQGASHSDYSSATPIRKSSSKREREACRSSKKKTKRARIEGTLENGHAELTNGGSPVSLIPNGHGHPANEISSTEEGSCAMFDGGWLLLHQLLCAPFTQMFMRKELRRLPFRNALSLVAFLGRLRRYSPELELASDLLAAEQTNTPQGGIHAMLPSPNTPHKRKYSVGTKQEPCASPGKRDGGGARQLLEVIVPTTDIVARWHEMLHLAHEQAILLEMELQNAACLDDAHLEEEETDCTHDLQLAHMEELVRREAEQETAAPVILKAMEADPLYSAEIINFPW